jgi:predicted secreted protein
MKQAIFVAVVLMACSPAPEVKQDDVLSSEAPASEIPVAPAVVSIRVLQDQNGQTVEVPVGQPFSVELRGQQPQGFSWSVVETPEFIAPAPDGSVRLPTPDQPEEQASVVGVGAIQTFFFVATAPGSSDLVFEHRRFGGAPPTRESFRFRIVAR